MAQRTHSTIHYVRSVIAQTWRHPSNEGRRGRAVARAVGWQLRKRVRPTPMEVDFFGWRLRCHPDSNSASNVVYFTPLYDVDEMDFMIRYLRPGDGFVDVGANIGTYSMLARRLVGPTGHVVAYEPDPVATRRFRENIELNRIENVRLHEAAVADAAGTVEFLEDYDVSNRIHSEQDGDAVATRTVEVVTLDETLHGHTAALGKLDVEGYETAALRGASGRLADADPPVWQVEIFDRQLARAGTTRSELLDVLERADFELMTYTRAGGLRPVDPGARPVSNVWAVHRAARETIERRLSDPPGGHVA